MNARRAALFALMAPLAGCAVFSRPTGRVCFDRQQFGLAWGRVKIAVDATFKRIEARIAEAEAAATARGRAARPAVATLGCPLPFSAQEIDRARVLMRQARQLAVEVDAALASPDIEPDWQRIFKVVEVVLEAAIL